MILPHPLTSVDRRVSGSARRALVTCSPHPGDEMGLVAAEYLCEANLVIALTDIRQEVVRFDAC